MSTHGVESIIGQALQMSEEERARIAERLILSLEKQIDPSVEIEWQKEIQRRLQDIDSGEVECIPWEDVCRRLRDNANAAR